LTPKSELISLNLDKDGEFQKERNKDGRSSFMFTCIVTAVYYLKAKEKTTHTSGRTVGHQILIE